MTGHLDVQVDAALFDMDGTLVDSNAVVEQMWSAFANEQSLSPSDVIAFAHGVPSMSTLRRFVPDSADIEAWFARISRWEEEHFDEVTQMPGAGQLLEALPADAWAVVTSALRLPALRRLAAVGFATPAVLIGADDVGMGKPDPEGYVAAARALGVDPSRCVVFEDTVAGILAARAAGAIPVVMGAVRHEAMEGIARLSDWRGVRVEQGTEARLHLLSD
ncbi:HAD-IA family hydrolase [Demequina sp. TTPB684]|uniref:HAD-IA family hydrolase n=1 Tax=unclassified Demequina TaxID=2620311 RepID=UPI001CF3D7D9|nr:MULTISPECIES: HAD-IA family hydrolase [unclassified Demequina]MCB2414004.1 HAD-IA family hydrolase [Demequina sp. TTPB684]UPU89115.1 HAD-IA family hydrolase [Demequina sp. TMPB413]